MSLILLLLAFINISFADDSPGLGANVGTQSNAFTVGNYNLFNWDNKFYGFYRYGGGGGRLQIGQGAGVSLSSTGGIMADQSDHSVLGLEIMNGTIVGNTNRSVESQYTFLPSVTAMGKLGPVMVGPKIGGYAGNLGGQGMTPNVEFQYGAQGFFSLGEMSAEFVYTHTESDLQIVSGEFIFKKAILRYENYKGLRDEVNYILMFKVGNL